MKIRILGKMTLMISRRDSEDAVRIIQGAVVAGRARATARAAEEMIEEYVRRAGRFCPVEAVTFGSETALFEAAARKVNQPAAVLVLFDSSGQMLSSEQFARYLERLRDDGAQRLVLGIGPADGWSDAGRGRGGMMLSLGRMTLPHQLARVMLAEQVYRALTILAGHPYHCGH